MNYYERHVGDYLKDTAHLSLLEHGVYTRLLDVYYTREGPIPQDQAARLIGARSKEERAALKTVLDEFFTLESGSLSQARCEREIERLKSKRASAKASADARWKSAERNADAMRTHSERMPNAYASAMRTHCDGNARAPVPSLQTPNTRHQEENGGIPPEPPARRRAREVEPQPLPAWVDAIAWDGYEAMRKAARKPMTPAARRLAVAELAKLRDSGQDPTDVLRQSTFRSWVGLFPVKDERVNGNAAVGAMSQHGLQTMRNAQALGERLFKANEEKSNAP